MVEDVARFWESNDFDLRLPNHNGKTQAGNCDLCFLKGTKTLIKIIQEKPELADWWIKQEDGIKEMNVGTEYENRTVSTSSFNRTRTYKDLVEMAKLDAKQVELFDDDSRSCFCHD